MIIRLKVAILLLVLTLPNSTFGSGEPKDGSVAIPSPALQASSARPLVNLELKQTPVRQAVSTLFAGTGILFRIDPTCDGVVSLRLTSVPLDRAVTAFATAAGLQVSVDNGVYNFAPATPTMRNKVVPPPVKQTDPEASVPVQIQPRKEGPKGQVFDVTLENADMFETIKQLMAVSQCDYVLDFGPAAGPVQADNPRITARMRNASLDSLLAAMAKAGNLQVSKLGNTYMIKWRPGVGGVQCSKCRGHVQSDWKYCPACGSRATSSEAGKAKE